MGKRYVITGSGGQLGRCLARGIQADGKDELLRAFTRAELDVGDRERVMRCLEGLPDGPPEVLVNAAAMTAVDACESEVDLARRVNAAGPGYLAELCAESGVQLVHVSTDYVFDGRASSPYREDATPAPASEYGRSKLEGEQRVRAASADFLVVRTSWVFGPGKNFPAAILRQARLRRSGEVQGPLRVVDDQVGAPTSADDLAHGIRALVAGGARGVVHLSNGGRATWWDFARAILDRAGYADLAIDRIRTEDLDLPAPRPRYSLLDCSRARSCGVELRHWPEALEAWLESPDGAAARTGS